MVNLNTFILFDKSQFTKEVYDKAIIEDQLHTNIFPNEIKINGIHTETVKKNDQRSRKKAYIKTRPRYRTSYFMSYLHDCII